MIISRDPNMAQLARDNPDEFKRKIALGLYREPSRLPSVWNHPDLCMEQECPTCSGGASFEPGLLVSGDVTVRHAVESKGGLSNRNGLSLLKSALQQLERQQERVEQAAQGADSETNREQLLRLQGERLQEDKVHALIRRVTESMTNEQAREEYATKFKSNIEERAPFAKDIDRLSSIYGDDEYLEKTNPYDFTCRICNHLAKIPGDPFGIGTEVPTLRDHVREHEKKYFGNPIMQGQGSVCQKGLDANIPQQSCGVNQQVEAIKYMKGAPPHLRLLKQGVDILKPLHADLMRDDGGHTAVTVDEMPTVRAPPPSILMRARSFSPGGRNLFENFDNMAAGLYDHEAIRTNNVVEIMLHELMDRKALPQSEEEQESLKRAMAIAVMYPSLFERQEEEPTYGRHTNSEGYWFPSPDKASEPEELQRVEWAQKVLGWDKEQYGLTYEDRDRYWELETDLRNQFTRLSKIMALNEAWYDLTDEGKDQLLADSIGRSDPLPRSIFDFTDSKAPLLDMSDTETNDAGEEIGEPGLLHSVFGLLRGQANTLQDAEHMGSARPDEEQFFHTESEAYPSMERMIGDDRIHADLVRAWRDNDVHMLRRIGEDSHNDGELFLTRTIDEETGEERGKTVDEMQPLLDWFWSYRMQGRNPVAHPWNPGLGTSGGWEEVDVPLEAFPGDIKTDSGGDILKQSDALFWTTLKTEIERRADYPDSWVSGLRRVSAPQLRTPRNTMGSAVKCKSCAGQGSVNLLEGLYHSGQMNPHPEAEEGERRKFPWYEDEDGGIFSLPTIQGRSMNHLNIDLESEEALKYIINNLRPPHSAEKGERAWQSWLERMKRRGLRDGDITLHGHLSDPSAKVQCPTCEGNQVCSGCDGTGVLGRDSQQQANTEALGIILSHFLHEGHGFTMDGTGDVAYDPENAEWRPPDRAALYDSLLAAANYSGHDVRSLPPEVLTDFFADAAMTMKGPDDFDVKEIEDWKVEMKPDGVNAYETLSVPMEVFSRLPEYLQVGGTASEEPEGVEDLLGLEGIGGKRAYYYNEDHKEEKIIDGIKTSVSAPRWEVDPDYQAREAAGYRMLYQIWVPNHAEREKARRKQEREAPECPESKDGYHKYKEHECVRCGQVQEYNSLLNAQRELMARLPENVRTRLAGGFSHLCNLIEDSLQEGQHHRLSLFENEDGDIALKRIPHGDSHYFIPLLKAQRVDDDGNELESWDTTPFAYGHASEHTPKNVHHLMGDKDELGYGVRTFDDGRWDHGKVVRGLPTLDLGLHETSSMKERLADAKSTPGLETMYDAPFLGEQYGGPSGMTKPKDISHLLRELSQEEVKELSQRQRNRYFTLSSHLRKNAHSMLPARRAWFTSKGFSDFPSKIALDEVIHNRERLKERLEIMGKGRWGAPDPMAEPCPSCVGQGRAPGWSDRDKNGRETGTYGPCETCGGERDRSNPSEGTPGRGIMIPESEALINVYRPRVEIEYDDGKGNVRPITSKEREKAKRVIKEKLVEQAFDLHITSDGEVIPGWRVIKPGSKDNQGRPITSPDSYAAQKKLENQRRRKKFIEREIDELFDARTRIIQPHPGFVSKPGKRAMGIGQNLLMEDFSDRGGVERLVGKVNKKLSHLDESKMRRQKTEDKIDYHRRMRKDEDDARKSRLNNKHRGLMNEFLVLTQELAPASVKWPTETRYGTTSARPIEDKDIGRYTASGIFLPNANMRRVIAHVEKRVPKAGEELKQKMERWTLLHGAIEGIAKGANPSEPEAFYRIVPAGTNKSVTERDERQTWDTTNDRSIVQSLLKAMEEGNVDWALEDGFLPVKEGYPDKARRKTLSRMVPDIDGVEQEVRMSMGIAPQKRIDRFAEVKADLSRRKGESEVAWKGRVQGASDSKRHARLELLKWNAEHNPSAVADRARDGNEQDKLEANIALNDAGHGTEEEPATWQQFSSQQEWRIKDAPVEPEPEIAQERSDDSDDDVDMGFQYSETPMDRAWDIILKNIV